MPVTSLSPGRTVEPDELTQTNEAGGPVLLDEDGHLVGPIIVRTATAAELDALTLGAGELAYATDTGVWRLGDGSTAGGVGLQRGTTIADADDYADGFTLQHYGARVIVMTGTWQDGGGFTSNATTPIADGTYDGQELVIVPTVAKHGYGPGPICTTIQAAGNCDQLHGDYLIGYGHEEYGDGRYLWLVWDEANSKWREVARRNVDGPTATGIAAEAEAQATASGHFSHAEGSADAIGHRSHAEGAGGKALGNNSHVEGALAQANFDSQHAHAAGMFATEGDAQYSRQPMAAEVLHDNTDWHSIYGSHRLDIPTDTFWGFHIRVVGATQGMAEVFDYTIEGAIKNDNDTTSLLWSNVTVNHETDVSFECRVQAVDGGGNTHYLVVETRDGSPSGRTVRWSGVAHLTEVGYPA